ncbi:MAG TPA: hypothetical protein VF062_05190 [Candidatus Limnocylindrales bacterium]
MILDREVDNQPYRLAYDVAAEYLGANAMHLLPLLTNLALLTREPETVFPVLLEAFRARASRLDYGYNHQLGLQVVTSADCRALYLGTSANVAAEGRVHPVLTRVMANLQQSVSDKLFQPLDPLIYGRLHTVDANKLMLMPAFFPPSQELADGRAALVKLGGTWTLDEIELVNAMRYVFAVSQLIQQELPDIEMLTLRPRAERAPLDQLDAPITQRNFEFPVDGRTDEGLARFRAGLELVERDPTAVRAFRSVCSISFPQAEFPDASPLFNPDVQAFLRRLFDAVPHLLYYLSDLPLHAALVEVVAAYAPDDVIERPDGLLAIGLTAESLTPILLRLRDAAAFAVRNGQEAGIVLRHVKELPDDLRRPSEEDVVQSVQVACRRGHRRRTPAKLRLGADERSQSRSPVGGVALLLTQAARGRLNHGERIDQAGQGSEEQERSDEDAGVEVQPPQKRPEPGVKVRFSLRLWDRLSGRATQRRQGRFRPGTQGRVRQPGLVPVNRPWR